MHASVVIPAYGDPVLTATAVRSVYEHDGCVEVVIVDNDGRAEHVEADQRIVNPENYGFARACNQGAFASTGDVIVFLNNDAQVTSRKAMTLLAEHAMVHGIAGCHLVRPDGTTHHGGVRVYRNDSGIMWAEEIQGQMPSGPATAVTAACMAIRRDLFAMLEGFDVGYWNGLEDIDLCLRARAIGARCWYENSITVCHEVSAGGPERWRAVNHNIRRFHGRWNRLIEQLPPAA